MTTTIVTNDGELLIRTNNVPRPTIADFELTKDEQGEFDYMDWDKMEKGEDSASFFRYKGDLYDIGEFTVPPPIFKKEGWDGYMSDSYFSGLVIKYVNVDGDDYVVVGTYLS